MRLPKRRITIPAAVCGITTMAALIAFQTGVVGTRAANVDPCAVGDTLQCLKTIDDDRAPIDDAGQAASNQDNTGANPRLGKNVFVNDPCLDPAAPSRRRTVQSETSIGVLYKGGSKKMVAGYNDSFGFYDNRQGLSGYAYTVDGGAHWIDGGGLPPVVANGAPLGGPPAADHYAGDPVIVVNQKTSTFYYASIYFDLAGHQTLSVNSGRFTDAPATGTESNSNTRCLNNPALSGTPDTSNLPSERIVWNKPVIAVNNLGPGDGLDKEWLFVSQKTGELYLSYTRFGGDGSTPLELVRSMDGGQTWTAPTTIVPNLNDTFNQATQPVVLPNGRVVVSWIARTFSANGNGPESDNRIEEAYSNNDGVTFSAPVVVAHVNPQGEPPGYNRGRRSILNAPFISFTGKGQENEGDGANGATIYLTYFNGKTPLVNANGIFTGPLAKAADIMLSRSTDGGLTWQAPVKVNDDAGVTSHVFPSVQAGKDGKVFVSWLDRRSDPANELTNAYADVSRDSGVTFGADQVQSDVATSWRVRADARPNFGDYNSSVLLGNGAFAMVWADGRFTPVPGTPATPDTIFTVATGLGDDN